MGDAAFRIAMWEYVPLESVEKPNDRINST